MKQKFLKVDKSKDWFHVEIRIPLITYELHIGLTLSHYSFMPTKPTEIVTKFFLNKPLRWN